MTLEASHEGIGSAKNSTQISVEIQFIDMDEEPFFSETTIEHTFKENNTEDFKIPQAKDLKGQTIYYYLYQSDNYKHIFKVDHMNGTLNHNENLDREEVEHLEVHIRASSSKQEIMTPADPRSVLTVKITVILF